MVVVVVVVVVVDVVVVVVVAAAAAVVIVGVVVRTYIERRNESHLLPDLSYIRDIIYFLWANDLFGIDLAQSSVCEYLF